MDTSSGPVDLVMDKRAPLSVNNFLAYVQSKGYDGTIIHRAPKNFVAQGGGYTVSSAGARHIPTRARIALECSPDRPNSRGTLAMARTPARDSATSEWFVNTSTSNAFLNCTTVVDGYAVFGRVTSPGMVAMDAIAALQVATRLDFTDLPLFTVRADQSVFVNGLVFVNSAVALPTPLSDADRALDFIEATYWRFLKPPGSVSTTGTASGVTYYFRYYATSNSYIGVSVPSNEIFYLVPEVGPNIVRFSSLAELMPTVSAAGY